MQLLHSMPPSLLIVGKLNERFIVIHDCFLLVKIGLEPQQSLKHQISRVQNLENRISSYYIFYGL